MLLDAKTSAVIVAVFLGGALYGFATRPGHLDQSVASVDCVDPEGENCGVSRSPQGLMSTADRNELESRRQRIAVLEEELALLTEHEVLKQKERLLIQMMVDFDPNLDPALQSTAGAVAP